MKKDNRSLVGDDDFALRGLLADKVMSVTSLNESPKTSK